MTARGIRNCNPGNIEWGDPWQGLVPESQRTDTRFCQFISPAWGIRALIRVLITYRDKYSIDTVYGIIARWAPSIENHTGAYIASVCSQTGFQPNETIDVTDYATAAALVRAITQHENGVMPYSQATIDEGLRLAGVVRQVATIRTPVGAATATAGATGAVAAAVEGYQQVQPLLYAAQSVAGGDAGASDWTRIIVAALVCASIAAALYAYWQHRQRVTA